MNTSTSMNPASDPHGLFSSSTVVWVTLLSGDNFEDRFNGDLYVFEAGQPVAMSYAAAQHIFGMGLGGDPAKPSELLVGRRFGLAQPLKPDLTKEWLKNWKFELAQAETRIVPGAPPNVTVQEPSASSAPVKPIYMPGSVKGR